MRIALFGASGMVGTGTLLECVDDPQVQSVLVVGRRTCGVVHPKVREILHADFADFSGLSDEFARIDACLFCLGVTSVGLSEAEYTRLTYDLTLAVARAMVVANPAMTFCYVSGDGTDSTERGRVMWARVKGRTENALLRLGFRAAFMFRPALIFPRRGVRSRTAWYQAFYTALGWAYPLWRAAFPRWVTTTAAHGRALLVVARDGYHAPILYSRDINGLAERARPARTS